MPSLPQEAATVWVKSSSPMAVRKVTSSPIRAMLWAMFRPTPPMDTRTCPGLESRCTRGARERPPMSLVIPPTTAT